MTVRASMLGYRPASSLIQRAVFDEQAETLSVWLKPAGRYVYEGVPRAVFEALMRAQSAGRYFNECIRGRFTCRRARRRYPLDD